jgi:CubicO group peptidase (beta-lactamase class C family)
MRVAEPRSAVFLDPDRRAKLEAAFPVIEAQVAEQQATGRFPGLSYGVVIDGELALAGGVGVMELGTARPVDEHTTYRIGSITKVFTALAVLQLRDAGMLELDDPVARHYAEFEGLVYPSRDSRRVRFIDLMTHSSGLTRLGPTPYWEQGKLPTEAEVSSSLDGFVLSREPGRRYEYSNFGYALLGLALSRVAEQPARDYIRDRLLQPLGMTHSGWDFEEVPAERRATPHRHDDEGKLVPTHSWRPGALETAGGLYSTVPDLARFAAWQLDAWPARNGDPDPILARASSRDAQTIHFADGANELGPTGVGWAWHIATQCYGEVVGHSGGTNGFRSEVALMPHHGVGVIVLVNSKADPGPVVERIFAALHETGALERRVLAPHPEVRVAAQAVLDMVESGDMALFEEHASALMKLKVEAEDLAAELAWEREQLGSCTLGRLLESSDLDVGEFELECERAQATLAIHAEIREGTTKWKGFALTELGNEPPPKVRGAAEAIVALRARWDEDAFRRIFAPERDMEAMRILLSSSRDSLGTCTLGEATMVRGPHWGRFRLTCEQGDAEMTIVVDADTPRVKALTLQSVGPGNGPCPRLNPRR